MSLKRSTAVDQMVYQMGRFNTPVLYGHLDGPNVISQGNGRRDLFESLEIYVKVSHQGLKSSVNAGSPTSHT